MMVLERSSNQVEEVLRNLGFQKIRRKNGNRPGFIACCVFHEENNPSFSIGDNGMWMCWTCGVKGNLRQLMQKLGMDIPRDWRFDLKMTEMAMASRKRRDEQHAKRMVNLPGGFSTYSFLGEVPAVIAKRFKWETIKKFNLGSVGDSKSNWRLRNRCIIPIYFKGRCVGYHGRALSADMVPRYYNPDGFSIKNHVFNYDGCVAGAELFVCEGAFNAMSMVEKGFSNTLSTFGTKFTSEQVSKISSLCPSSVTICFDRDKSKIVNGKEMGRGGQRAAMALGVILSDLFKVEIMPLPPEKDPNDLPAETLVECHNRRVPLERFKR
jgi:DNA primase